MINAHSANDSDAFQYALEALPPLPSIIHYEDDYDDLVRSVKTSECSESVTIHVSGQAVVIRFDRVEGMARDLVRYYLLWNMQEMAPASVVHYYRHFSLVSGQDLLLLALADPLEAKVEWPSMSLRYQYQTMAALKSLLRFCCKFNFMKWSPLYADFASYALNIASADPYSTVRAGKCFLTTFQEASLVRWIDQKANEAEQLERRDLELACLVVCSYQFGMRPKQLGMVRVRDCVVRQSHEDGSQIVHLTFRMIKQRDGSLSGMPLVRKVKREWAPLFRSLIDEKRNEERYAFLFGFTSRVDLSFALNKQFDEILPGAGITTYDLRHTMAQRLVDSGASQEELAAALGHSVLRTGLVYFDASANQAELVNRALGASQIYQVVAKIAREKFINPDELARLTGEQQIAGVPHGIPIAGIGGCSTGQPACPSNPVTSCYGCPKFMPVHDLEMHKQVLREFRSVVMQFRDIGQGDMSSPAYLQLQRTISEVQAVITELEAENA